MSGDHPIRMAAVSAAELSELVSEPGFLAALATHWRGEGPIEDAVHWRLHPSTTAPSGRPDPAASLVELRARVYSRAVVGEPVVEVTDASGLTVRLGETEARLLLLEQWLELEAGLLDAAIEEAHRTIGVRADQLDDETYPPADLGLFARVLRRHPAVVFGTAAALLVGLVVPATAASLAPSLTPSAGLLKVFNRPQGITDIAPQVFTGGQPGATQEVRDTTRFLGAFYGVQVFAYRDSADQVCLLSTAPTGHDVTVCATVRAFARTGLSIAPVNYQVDYSGADAAAGVTAASRLAFRWGPDSDLTVRVVG
ncbi:hypothetical protein ACVXZ4_03995 [Lacisediminihabitans sp. FW035]